VCISLLLGSELDRRALSTEPCLAHAQHPCHPEIILRIADYLNVPERIPDFFAAVDEDNNWATEQGLDDSHLSEQGLRAREERKAMELSQTELAEIEGVTANKICRRETERLTWKAKKKEEKNK